MVLLLIVLLSVVHTLHARHHEKFLKRNANNEVDDGEKDEDEGNPNLSQLGSKEHHFLVLDQVLLSLHHSGDVLVVFHWLYLRHGRLPSLLSLVFAFDVHHCAVVVDTSLLILSQGLYVGVDNYLDEGNQQSEEKPQLDHLDVVCGRERLGDADVEGRQHEH